MDTETTSQKAPEKSEVDSTILSSRALYQHDPLLVLLKDKLHLGTLWIVLGGFVFGGLISFIFFPIVISDFHPFVSLGDAFDLLLFILANTFSLLINLLLPASMASVFNTLRANGAIGPSRQERLGAMSYARFLEHMVAWVDSMWWSITIVMFSILYFLYTIFINNQQSLTLPPLLLLVNFVIVFFPEIYFLSFGFLRVMLLLIFVNRLFFLFSIRVRPLHADGSGGLAALSQMWWMGAALLFVEALLIFAVIGHLSARLSPFEIISITIAYPAVIIALAIGWLALPHRVMLQAQNEHLQPLAEEYERVLMETRPTADEQTVQIVAGTERLSALKQRYELVRDTFPTWPLQIMEMRRLAVALLLPALISLLPALFNMFTKK
jgi:hypothetical protein